jgi:hypothetical protein
MRFSEVVLLEPEKNVVALADAYFFPPFQPSLLPRSKGSAVIPSRLPPRRAKLVIYNKHSNETSIWIVELSEVHAATRGGHHRGKVISSEVIPDVQPAMVSVLNSLEYCMPYDFSQSSNHLLLPSFFYCHWLAQICANQQQKKRKEEVVV